MAELISIEPAQTCEFLVKCQKSANQALIWKYKIQERAPRRWVMMPVCWSCLSAALVQYPPDNETEEATTNEQQ